VEILSGGPGTRHQVVNLGTGVETSVLELIALVERVTGPPVPHRFGEPRPGDAARSVADVTRAVSLGFGCRRSLEEAIRSAMPIAAAR
jgi:UDP-glucose 4-epimerase